MYIKALIALGAKHKFMILFVDLKTLFCSAYHTDQNDAQKEHYLQLHIHARPTLDLWGVLLQV